MKSIKSLFLKYLCCSASVILCNCSFIPEYEKPHSPVAESYPRKINCVHQCAEVSELGWQDFFRDRELKELIELALKNNRDLRVAIQRMEEASAQYGIQRSALFPTVNADGAELKVEAPGDIIPITPNVNQPFNLTAYVATLGVSSWEVDFWGHLRSLNEAALENYLATEEAQHATYVSLIQQVANAYLTDRELNEMIAITEATVKNRQNSYHLIQRRFAEGYSTKIDVAEADTLLQQANSDLTVFHRQREQNFNALTLLVGTEITLHKKTLPKNDSNFIREIAPGLPSELMYNRPDILAAEHQLKAANANIGAARAAFFPTISLTGMYGTASPEFNNLFSDGTKLWVYLPEISLPIFDWGKRESNLELAEVRKNIAVAQYEHTIQVAFREVADALAANSWLAKQVSVQNLTVDAQKERARLTELRYQHGSSAYTEVLDAERDELSAEQALVQTKYALLESRINLYTALGGGYFREEETDLTPDNLEILVIPQYPLDHVE